ncbi:hypothetical protein [Corynebacterium aquatimens]
MTETTTTVSVPADSHVPGEGPQGLVGPEFGKAAPTGLFIVVALAVVVISIGWAFHRRFSRFNRRRMFADEHGIDVFDSAAVDKAMAEEGLLDQRKSGIF